VDFGAGGDGKGLQQGQAFGGDLTKHAGCNVSIIFKNIYIKIVFLFSND